MWLLNFAFMWKALKFTHLTFMGFPLDLDFFYSQLVPAAETFPSKANESKKAHFTKYLRLFHIPYEMFLLTELQCIAFNC